MKREGNSPRRAIELQCLHKTAAGERRPTPKAWCLPVKKGRGVTLRRAPAVKNNETKKIEVAAFPDEVDRIMEAAELDGYGDGYGDGDGNL